MQGRIPEAAAYYRHLPRGSGDDELSIYLQATGGLLRFRSGDPAEGRRLYTEAVAIAERREDHYREVMAILHLAREELVARTGQAADAFRWAMQMSEGRKEPEINTLRELLVRLHGSRPPLIAKIGNRRQGQLRLGHL